MRKPAATSVTFLVSLLAFAFPSCCQTVYSYAVLLPELDNMDMRDIDLESRLLWFICREMGKVNQVVNLGADKVYLVTKPFWANTEEYPEGTNVPAGALVVQTTNLQSAREMKFSFAQAIWGEVNFEGVKIEPLKILVIGDSKGCFETYGDLATDFNAFKDLLSSVKFPYELFLPAGAPGEPVNLPPEILKDKKLIIDCPEIVSGGFLPETVELVRNFIDQGGSLIAIEGGCYRYVTDSTPGEYKVKPEASLRIVQAKAIHGSAGDEGEITAPESPFLYGYKTFLIARAADPFRRTSFQEVKDATILVTDDQERPLVLTGTFGKGKYLLIGPRIFMHGHDGNLGDISKIDRLYNLYNARFLANSIYWLVGKPEKVSYIAEKAEIAEERVAKTKEISSAINSIKGSFGEQRHLLDLATAQGIYAGYFETVLKMCQSDLERIYKLLRANALDEASMELKKLEETLELNRSRLNLILADMERVLLLQKSTEELLKELDENVDKFKPAQKEIERAKKYHHLATQYLKVRDIQKAKEFFQEAFNLAIQVWKGEVK